MSFKSDDKEMALKFGKLLSDHAKFSDLSVNDIINLSRGLVWYNGLTNKIDASIMEVVAIHQPQEASKKAKTKG
jgi:hypothetical protein